MELRDRWVNFRISSVYHPSPRDLAIQLHGNDLLQGKVLGFSDSGTRPRAYVIVKVEALDDPIVLPMESVLGVL